MIHIDKFDWSPEGMLENTEGAWMKKDDVLEILGRLLEQIHKLQGSEDGSHSDSNNP